jgi:hypothetical protein
LIKLQNQLLHNVPQNQSTEIDELKMVYQEIIEGCSYSPKGFFIKHLCEIEQIEVTRKRLEFINKYVEQGIPTEDERFLYITQNEEWTATQEGDILAYRQTIADNEKLIHSIIPEQQSAIKNIIEEHKKNLFALLMERKLLIGTTAEELASKDETAFMSYLSLYGDRQCTQPIFNKWEDFENLEETEMSNYIDAIDDVLVKLQEPNIRKISALPFFLNAFSYCKEDIAAFIGKPISRLTNYQIHLFSLGLRNLNILSQAEGSPPEYFEKVKAEDIIKWYDSQYSIILGKRKHNS